MNLLKETLEILENNDKSPKDIKWIGNNLFKTDWKNFIKVADIEYDAGYGSPKVAQDLLIVGKNWWLERNEYDGSEWWEFKSIPIEPKKSIKFKSFTIEQAENNGFEVSCGWESLNTLNGIEES